MTDFNKLAGREGFVMVPREDMEQIAGALADVLATFQYAEPEALKAAIQHSNRSAHAAYTLVYGLLAAAPKGTYPQEDRSREPPCHACGLGYKCRSANCPNTTPDPMTGPHRKEHHDQHQP